MMQRFKHKTAIILGGNSGIGLAAAKMFAAEGAKTIITGRDKSTINSAVSSIPKSEGHVVDISDLDAMASFASRISASHDKIDVLFINAGVGGFATVAEMTTEFWDHVHSINLRGCAFAARVFLPLLQPGSSIVFTGSIGGHAALYGNSVYAASKAGLSAFMKTLAKELVGEGVRVNMISPGPTDTPIITKDSSQSEEEIAALREIMTTAVPMGRMGTSDEVAESVLFLASEAARFITGVELFVDGGTLELR